VAASLCIEQVGMPQLTAPASAGTSELWNGISVEDRLRELKERTARSSEKPVPRTTT
jgi:hypothetical protein